MWMVSDGPADSGQRGRRADGPFKHDTGKGFVEARPGQYAGRAHNADLVCVIVEATGGIARAGRAQVGLLARRATGKQERARPYPVRPDAGAAPAAARASSTCITRA